MSSLRFDSLRLVWLETLVAVAEEESISAAARELGCDQSTVSRNMQALAKWSGKELIEIGKVNDPDNPGINVWITDAGKELRDLAVDVIEKLTAFRTEEAQRDELLARMDAMVSKMLDDLQGKRPSQTVLLLADPIQRGSVIFGELRQVADLGLLDGYFRRLRRFFANYEDQLNRERRKKRRSRPTSAAHIDMSRYKTRKDDAP